MFFKRVNGKCQLSDFDARRGRAFFLLKSGCLPKWHSLSNISGFVSLCFSGV